MQAPKGTPLFQLVQNIVPERWDERRCGFVVQLIKEPVPVPRGAEDVAFSRLKGLLSFLRAVRLFCIVLIARGLFVVGGHQGRRSVNSIMAEYPLVPPQYALNPVCGAILRGLDGRAAVDRVGHGPNILRIAAEPDRADDPSFFVVIQDDGIRIRRQPRFCFGVVVAELNESAF